MFKITQTALVLLISATIFTSTIAISEDDLLANDELLVLPLKEHERDEFSYINDEDYAADDAMASSEDVNFTEGYAGDDGTLKPLLEDNGSGDDVKIVERTNLGGDEEGNMEEKKDDTEERKALPLGIELKMNLSGNNFMSITKEIQEQMLTMQNGEKSDLPILLSVDLSSNALTEIDPEAFSQLTALYELDLSDNNELRLPNDSLFLHSPSLKKIKLADCELKQIPENTFDGMTSLEVVDLAGNPIAEETPITSAVFVTLPNLTMLILPSSSENDTLIKETCESHGLLLYVCIEDCSNKAIPCHIPSNEEDNNTMSKDKAKEELNKLLSDTSDTLENAKDDKEKQIATEIGRKISEGSVSPPKEEMPKVASEGEETILESSKGVSASGVNNTIIGLLIGGMVAVVAGILIKKNWSKIKGKSDEPRRSVGMNHHQRPAADVERGSPESIPLKGNDNKPSS